MKELRGHLAADHKLSSAASTKEFKSSVDFTVWLRGIESSTLAQFVSNGRKRTLRSGEVVHTLHCSRDGNARGAEDRVERMHRTKPSRKLGHKCAAQIDVHNHPDGSVTAMFFAAHSHDIVSELDLRFLRLTEEDLEQTCQLVALQSELDFIVNSFRSDIASR